MWVRGPVAWYVLLLVLTALAGFTAGRVEVLNAQAGFYLPRDFAVDGGKWRQSLYVVTAAENARNQMRDVVGTWGLVQYPLTYGLVVAYGVTLYRRPALRWRMPLVVGALATVGCVVLMHYRGYFTALGW